MDRKTAADIIHHPEEVSLDKSPRSYRTHPDKLAPFWLEVEELLKNDSKLKAYVLFEEMRRRHPDSFDASWKRTFERRVHDWKVEHRIEKDVTFDQIHEPGDVLAVDFTNMNELGITIGQQRFDHLVFHGVLTYSNWEYVELCASESFEALAKGIQGCFQAIGGVTKRIRNDSLSAAVNNLSTERHFTANFTKLLNHFRVESHRINVRTPRENGDCESLHGHFKDYVDQRLRIRGSRDFESRQAWLDFLRECIASKNALRASLFLVDQEALAELPPEPFPTYTMLGCTVSSNSIITVKQNRYSVPSCFIGNRVQIRVFADTIQLWHAGKQQLNIPRLVGKNEEYIDFRHVIDSLVRKPAAFANYRYREHMFPTLELRKAFDTLVAAIGESNGIRVYLRLLHVAKNEGLATIAPWVTQLLIGKQEMNKKNLLASLDCVHATVPATGAEEVNVEVPDLEPYDDLLEHKEVLDEPDTEPEYELDDSSTRPLGTGFPFETTSSTDDACDGDKLVGASRDGELDALEVSERTDDSRMRITSLESDSTRIEEVGPRAPQDLGSDRLETTSVVDPSTHGCSAQRRVSQRCEQSLDIRAARFGENVIASCAGMRTRSFGPFSMYGTVLAVGATSSTGQEGASTTAISVEARQALDAHYRRSWLCSTNARGNGSTLYVDRELLREDEHTLELESSVFKMGEHLQRSDDDSCGDRPVGTSQHHHRVERSELSSGTSQQESHDASFRSVVLNQTIFHWGNLTDAKVQF
jgi:transposase